ncbi:calpain-A-like [Macrosteles quadrilineatus]|uniref:calpain-A-like n=1 Tax=Macrosteles quadrilineatus TaxID=74068 RepID=UPI0023E193E5|nr:calpain-A-like [Macrosteles quadrilineatus]
MTRKLSLFKEQDYNKIQHDCLKKGELFQDDLFELDVPGATWLRPKDIVKDPQFFVGGASRFDVVQGKNAGCWLIVAMANLTMNPVLFHHVVPKEQSFTDNYAGVFRFNIWQCGQWEEIVVDDRLPTKDGPEGSKQLIFVRSKRKNEFWSPLLEKAYAKLYGSYNELTSGWFNEAMVDFTGGIVERVTLKPAPKNLTSIILKSLEKSSFMCVFMSDDPSIKEMVTKQGLVKGHAYSINKTQTVSISGGKSEFLIRLRNPWGKLEWKGAWSDSSAAWQLISLEEKTKMGLVTENDGEFWMSLMDFSQNFEYIDICHLGPEMFSVSSGKTWESHFFKGQWTKGISAGGFSLEKFHLNPQYRITLNETDDNTKLCTVIIGLLQKHKTRKIWHKIGFTAFRLEEPEKSTKTPLSVEFIGKNFENSSSSKFRRHRENVVRDSWEPGVYCIVPSTFKADEEGQFLLRVYSEKKSSMEEHELNEDVKQPVQVKEIAQTKHDNEEDSTIEGPKAIKLLQKNEQDIAEYFIKVAGIKREINWEGLQSVLEYALTGSKTSNTDDDHAGFFTSILSYTYSLFSTPSESKIFTKHECRSMISLLDDDVSGKLNLREFKVLWRKLQNWESIYIKHCGDENNLLEGRLLRKALKSTGYDVKNNDISRLVLKYCDQNGNLAFDDFVMCAIEVLNKTV